MGFWRKKGCRRLSLALAVVLVVSLVSGGSLAVTPPDIVGHWGEARIQGWLDQGLAVGYPDGTFRPNAPVTRAEFTAFLVRYYQDRVDETDQDPGFADVEEGDWFYGHVAAATEAGLISGYEDNTFRPNRNISRQEAAVILHRLLDLEDEGDAIFRVSDEDEDPLEGATVELNGLSEDTDQDGEAVFTDLPIDTYDYLVELEGYESEDGQVNLRREPLEDPDPFIDQDEIAGWAEEAVVTMAAFGIIVGYPDYSFRPLNETTRAETVHMIERAELLVEPVVVEVTLVSEVVDDYTVTFIETNQLEDVDIEVFDDQDDLVASLSTDDQGEATTGLDDGDYTFTAAKAGYEDYDDGFEVDGEDKTVEFTMVPLPTGAIRGMVTLPEETWEIPELAEEIVVEVAADGAASDTVTLTDEERSGDYLLADLPYGEYEVSAEVVGVTPLEGFDLEPEDFWMSTDDDETVEVDADVVPGPDYVVLRALLISLVELNGEGLVEGAFDGVTEPLAAETESFRVLRGTDVTFTALPDEGWVFDVWTEDAAAQTDPTFTVTIDNDFDVGIRFVEP